MKTHFKIILVSVIIFAMSMNCHSQVSIYVAAHPDDWQLFMGVNAYGDMVAAQSAPNNRVVFIHLTAGDGGNPMSWNNEVLAREECVMNSIKFAANAGTNIGATAVSSSFGPHSVKCVTYGNIVSYFLRLPDGCNSTQGCGGWGSLQGLHNGTYTSLTPLDGSTTYSGWADLVATIYSIMGIYNSHNTANYPSSKIWVNAPEPDSTVNVSDHRDHRYAGMLAIQCSMPYCPYTVSFLDYCSGSLSPNLTTNEIENESALFGACTLGLAEAGRTSSWDSGHKGYLDRNYYKVYEYDCEPYQDDDKNYDKKSNSRSFSQITTGSQKQMKAAADNAIGIYPNPTTERLNVKSSSGNNQQAIYKIEILDVMARNILMSVENEYSIDIHDLNSGIYFAKVYTSSNQFTLHKFSKQ